MNAYLSASRTDHRPSTIDHRPSTTDHRPPTTDHRPPTTDFLLYFDRQPTIVRILATDHRSQKTPTKDQMP